MICTSSSGWQKRNNLAIMGFLGLALMYSLRFCLSIGIVAMVDHEGLISARHRASTKSNNSANDPSENGICPGLLPTSTKSSVNDSSSSMDSTSTDEATNIPTFQWNEKEQGLILGSFFWGYVFTQFPGGFLAQRFGAKWVISLGLLCAGLLSLALPWAASTGGKDFVVAVRVLQGVSEGVIIPSFATLLGKWTTPNERAGLGTFCFSGMPFGTATTMIISGHLISSFGWPAVFYAPGILTVIWFIFWTLLVYSSPSEHPTISQDELHFLEKSISERNGGTNDGETHQHHSLMDIPWKSILGSVPVWAILMSHFCNTWGHNTLKAEGPKYLHSVLHFDIHENAYIAATPYFCQWAFCNIVTRVSDHLISKKWLSLTAARRLCNTIGQAGTAFAYLGLILSECNRPLAVVAFMMSGLFNGAVYGGMMINPIDISPNYAGVIEGLINGASQIAGFGAPFVAGLILHQEPSIRGWHYVFLIPVIGDLLGNLGFIIFCSTEVQPWDSKPRKKKACSDAEKVRDE